MADTSLVFNLLAKDKASGIMKNFGRNASLAMAAAAAGVAAFVGVGLKSLVRIEKINAQTTAALASTGNAANVSAKQIADLGGSLESLTGVEQETIQEGQNLLLTFTAIQNKAGAGNDIFNQATKTMTDMSVALGQDMSSSAIQLGKALNDPIKGVTALQRVGVSFTQQQRDQIEALVKSGDTLGAQKVILAELNKEFGGSAEAFGATTAGKVERFKHAVGTLQEELAGKLLPAMSKVVNQLMQLAAWGELNKSWLFPTIIAVGSLTAVIYTIVIAVKIWTAVSIAAKAATVVWAGVQWLLNAAMLANPIVLIVLAIIVLIGIIVLIATKTTFFQTVWNTVWGGIKAAAAAVGAWFAGPFAGFFISLFGKITGGVTAARNWVVSTFLNLVSFVAGLPGRMAAAAAGMFDGIRNAFRGAVNWVIRAWNNLSFTLPSVNIPGLGKIGGFTLNTPNIPLLAAGGMVERTGLAVVHRGEQVIPAQAAPLPAPAGGPVVLRIESGGSRLDDLLVDLLRKAVRTRGGNVQLVLGPG